MKHLTNPKVLIADGDISENITSEVFDIRTMEHVAVQAVVSDGSSPTGDLTVEGSVDGETFASLGTAYEVAVSADVSHLFNIPNAGFSYLRVIWEADETPGTGTLNVIASAKAN